MDFLKKFFLGIVIIGSLSYAAYIWNRGPCSHPVEYRIGELSGSFNISEAALSDALSQAEKIWEAALGKDLFSYSPSGGISVNLIYDERQELANRNRVLGAKIDQARNQAAGVEAEIDALKNRYESLSAAYDGAIREYSAALKSYNGSVDFWNKKGGAPEKEYERLQAESSRLEGLRIDLEKKRQEVNDLADQINARIGEYNSLIRASNANAEIINESADEEFKQGQYIADGNGVEIDIYEFDDRNDLVRVLAHEFGHALHMDHNGNEESIMYHLNSGKKLELSAEDFQSLKAACDIE
jgi:hypothetical protein